MGGVNGAVYCVVQKQKALFTVLSVGNYYVPNRLYEIGHTMYSTAAEGTHCTVLLHRAHNVQYYCVGHTMYSTAT